MIIKMVAKTTTEIENSIVKISVFEDRRISFTIFSDKGVFYMSVSKEQQKDKQCFDFGYVCNETIENFVYTKTELLD